MKLETYLRLMGLTHEAFAEKLGVPQATITRYVNGHRFPRPEMLLRIQQETGGAVTANDFVGLERAPRRRAVKAASCLPSSA